MIIYDFVISDFFIIFFVACEQNYLSRVPFSPILLLLLLGHGYCLKCKGKFPAVFFFFFLEAVIFID